MTSSSSSVPHPQVAIVDVGASTGLFAIPAARENPNILVLAVEPLEAAADELARVAHESELSNLQVVRCAVGPVEGTAKLHVSSGLGEVSSLLRPGPAIDSDPYWMTRGDLRNFTATVEVDVRRLDSILETAGIDRVAFIKLDAQGLDVVALATAGNCISRVDAGMLEVASVAGRSLYEHQDDLRTALNTLADLGFVIEAIKPNDPACNEVNVFFRRPHIDWLTCLAEIGSERISLIHEKDYWSWPSSSLEGSADAAHRWAEEAHELRTRIHELETELHDSATRLHAALSHAVELAGRETQTSIARAHLENRVDALEAALDALQGTLGAYRERVDRAEIAVAELDRLRSLTASPVFRVIRFLQVRSRAVRTIWHRR
jgi:FkbM family methyltransferase